MSEAPVPEDLMSAHAYIKFQGGLVGDADTLPIDGGIKALSFNFGKEAAPIDAYGKHNKKCPIPDATSLIQNGVVGIVCITECHLRQTDEASILFAVRVQSGGEVASMCSKTSPHHRNTSHWKKA